MLLLVFMFLQNLASRLRAARAAADVTQEHAAEHAQCSVRSIAHYEHATAEVGAETLYRLAVLYRVSADWLLHGRTPMPHRFIPVGTGYAATKAG